MSSTLGTHQTKTKRRQISKISITYIGFIMNGNTRNTIFLIMPSNTELAQIADPNVNFALVVLVPLTEEC